jgi:hypothetical protein
MKIIESYSDDLNDYQIQVVRDMAEMDIECGHPMNYENALEACLDDEDLSDVAEEAAQYYMSLVGLGAADCYEEPKYEECEEKIFESILNEEINRTNYPTKTSFNNGKVKKVPLVMKYIYENPGCTKEDIINFTNSMGFTGYNNELLADIVDDGMVTTSKKGRKLAFYPTDLLTGYLHTLGFIDDDSGDEIYNQFTTNKDGYVQAQKHKQCIARTRSYFVDRLSQAIHDIKKPSYRFPDISKDWAKLNDDEKREILVTVASKIILK